LTYSVGDLETIELPTDSFELVYSSLTLHYLPDIERIMREVYGSLVPSGRFVFSIEHPIYTAPSISSFELLQNGEEDQLIWPLDSYGNEGLRVTNWLAEGVRKYHRTMDTYISALLNTGFILTSFKEWMPSEEDLEEHPEWQRERDRPMFLLIAVQMPSAK
jgi:SAM-dependent methyltransferase